MYKVCIFKDKNWKGAWKNKNGCAHGIVTKFS